MIRKTLQGFLLTLLIAGGALWAQVPINHFLPTEAASRADQLYKEGSQALDESRWDVAAAKFGQVAELHSLKADASLYWKAYAQNKLGRRQEAISTIAALRRHYPRSTWIKDAAALELEINKAAGRHVDPGAEGDEEVQLLALNTLMNSDPNRAVPALKKLLMSSKSTRLKERALFILAQGTSDEAQQALIEVAHGKMNPELQRRAVEYLASNPSERHRAALIEIYRQSSDKDVRHAVLNSYISCACKTELFAMAQQERDPELRRMAVNGLIALAAKNEIDQLYDSAASLEEKRDILKAMLSMGDADGIIKASHNLSDPEMRKLAVDGLASIAAKKPLADMYASERDPSMKRRIVDNLVGLGAVHELIAIDRKETDPHLHKFIVQRLTSLGGREVEDYMVEILNR